MKLKGISIFEQHVEKIVLGATVLIAGGLGAMQFLTNPNAVEFDRDTYAPSKVDEAIQSRADSLRTRLDSDEHIEFRQDESLSQWFSEQHAMAYGDGVSLSNPIVRPTPLQLGEASAITGTIGLYAELKPSAPTELRAVGRPYTLSDSVLSGVPELAAYLPKDAPYDIGVVHLFGKVNGSELRQQLHAPVDEDRNAIPSAWWDQQMEIMDVVVERQRQFSDGTWSETEIVSTIPGQQTVREEMGDAESTETSGIQNVVFAAEENLYQPPFYNMMGDEPWSQDLVKELEPLSEDEERAVALMKRGWNELVTAQRKLERYENRENTRDNRTGPTDSGPGGLGEGGSGKGGGGGFTSSGDREKDQKKRTRDRLEGDIEDALTKYEKEKEFIRELIPTFDRFPDEEPVKERRQPGSRGGPDTDEGAYQEYGMGEGGPSLGEGGGKGGGRSSVGERGGRPSRDRGRGRRDTPAFLEDEEDREIWAHDINIVPGAVYRYRMRVDYFNPFFGKTERLADEQKPLAEKMYVSSTYTEWGEPINVVSTRQFYVVSGAYDDLVENRRASVEVYVYTGGAQRMSVLSVKPGEPIGDIKTFNVEAEVPEEDPSGRPSGRDRDENDETVLPTTVDVDFSTGAVLLDVIEIEEGLTTRDRKVQVLVALEDGSIVALDPDTQRSSDDRRRLRELATKEPNS